MCVSLWAYGSRGDVVPRMGATVRSRALDAQARVDASPDPAATAEHDVRAAAGAVPNEVRR